MKKTLLSLILCAAISGVTASAIENNKPAYGSYPDFTYAAETAVKAVVYVKVTVPMQMVQGPSSIFDFFFGPGLSPNQGMQREQVGSGSGVIISSDGYIVTNNHVVADASKIEVTLNDNQTYTASLVGADSATDVAVIKIDAQNLPAIKFDNSDNLRLGEWVLAIGSPYDLRSTITAGIVSAKGRSMPNYGRDVKIESFIQTDAAVNPGNSGGALVNLNGDLVGVNTAIVSQTGSYAGYSFAIPSNMVRKISDDLISFGSVKRAVLGITISEIDAKRAGELKLSSPKGVYINEVIKDGAAYCAGIKSGDIILSVDSANVNSFALLQEALSRFRPGDKTTVKVLRNGEEKVFEVTLLDSNSQTGSKVQNGISFYGSTIAPASKDKLAEMGLKHGVEIVAVGPGKIQEAGVQPGFIITYVNDVAVEKPQDILNVIKNSKRAVYIEGVNAMGRPSYFGFGM